MQYVRRKHGQESISYIHPKLESVLKDTYGVLIFQEQITKAAMVLADFSEREADDIRKAMGKKMPELMKQQKSKFVKRCGKNEIQESLAISIWDEIEKFAGYSFNRAHSVEYGYITYYIAYLKAHYPHHYMAALLNNNYSIADKLRLYLQECYHLGIEVLPPSVKHGNYDFGVYNNKIVFGLKGVNGIGEKTAKAIYEYSYDSFEDFCIKARPSKAIVVTLAEAGALDDFRHTRNTLIESAPTIVESLKSRKTNPKSRSLFEVQTHTKMLELPELPDNVLAIKEYSKLNTYLKYDPLKNVELTTPEELKGLIFIEGFISQFESRITKKKNTIGIITLSTKLGPLEVIIFPKLYLEIKDKVKNNMYVAVEGVYEDKLIARKIWPKYV
jgi:DNA polymerase-3 subunit alpha